MGGTWVAGLGEIGAWRGGFRPGQGLRTLREGCDSGGSHGWSGIEARHAGGLVGTDQRVPGEIGQGR